jgi:hypothetical protein
MKTTPIISDISFNEASFFNKEDKHLSSIDDIAEFYDPYSDLNLFLVQKITQEMRHCGNAKKWSSKIQEELLNKISPEFQKKFPRYRLGTAALKKTWEKVVYFSHQIQQQKEAITQDGKLNIHFFIRENLKKFPSFRNYGPLHPSHFAQQLGMKMSECIAAVDGARPKLDHLTKLIWSIQRHLIRSEQGETLKCPYDEYDKIDKLIVKTILEMTVKDPQIGHNELEFKVKEAIHALQELPGFASSERLTGSVSALLAEKLYPASPFHHLFFAEQKSAIIHFIQRHSALCRPHVGTTQLTELVRRVMALYTLASGLPKNLSDEAILTAVQACYPIALAEKPDLPQSLYAFLSAELVLMRNEGFCHSPAFVSQAIVSAYKEAVLLPELCFEQMDLLEMVIWKTMSEMEGLLEKLPYKNGQRIEEEIANILMEHPQKKFSSLVHATTQFFKRSKELADTNKSHEIERKIHTWIVQGDMLHRWIHLDQASPLMKLILSEWKKYSTPPPHPLFVSSVCQEYLKQHPELAIYSGQLSQRVWILYKHAWYAIFGSAEESSYERFLKWHAFSLRAAFPHATLEFCIEKLQELVKKMLPLIPFDSKHCAEIINIH